ncbi:ubiquinol-cytochrome c reductase iron-sulfur subunit [Halobacterium yunchengense]|uniref:ubiquinol-cytochrome c reductase iron-sulfur subunit n=1 Tax=Halobacterium yunchengense TaxID=3108497 RepID=UPI00300A92B6
MSDKYPESSGRRRFVKGVVGSAAVAGIGTAGVAAVDSITNPTGAGGGPTDYFGVENTAGPAPRAMPMIPVEVDDEGYLRGVYPEIQETETETGEVVQEARMELGGIEYSANWFQYCGVQTYEGVRPGYDGDNYFRYSGGYDWQPSSGRVSVDDFEDYETWENEFGDGPIGKPAKATWRSQDTENSIPIQLIRSSLVEEKIAEESGEAIDWLEAATTDGFMAILNKCTHFCCAPQGFRTSNYGGSGDKIYCQCHQSIYDPYSIVKRSFVAFARPEE